VIVVDASALIEVLLQTERGQIISETLLAADENLNAPHLIDVEVSQVLRRYCLSDQMTSARAREALQDLIDFPIHRYPHDLFIERIWELRRSLTAYDAAYVALSEALDARLITCDGRIAAASGHTARVAVY